MAAISMDLTATGDRKYTNLPKGSYNSRALYGGWILAQSIMAAYDTVSQDFHIHSLQATFIVRGRPGETVEYDVQPLMDGRSYAKRQVTIQQTGSMMAQVLASFKVKEDNGPAFKYIPAAEHPQQISGPDKLLNVMEAMEEKIVANCIDDNLLKRLKGYKFWLSDFPFEIKPVNPDVQLFTVPNSTNKLYKWFRLTDNQLIDVDKVVGAQSALLAFISDFAILQPILTIHCTEAVGFMVSLDHTMWFHNNDVDVRQWLLLDVECIIATNGTSLNHGRIWSADGALLATFMQEGVIRPQLPSLQ